MVLFVTTASGHFQNIYINFPRHLPSTCIILCPGIHSLANACLEGNVNAVRKLLEQGWSVHDSTDEGESLLSLACSAGETFWKVTSSFLVIVGCCIGNLKLLIICLVGMWMEKNFYVREVSVFNPLSCNVLKCALL